LDGAFPSDKVHVLADIYGTALGAQFKAEAARKSGCISDGIAQYLVSRKDDLIEKTKPLEAWAIASYLLSAMGFLLWRHPMVMVRTADVPNS